MKKLLPGLLIVLLLSPALSYAQGIRCGHEKLMERLESRPDIKQAYIENRQQAALKVQANAQAKSTKSTAAYKIPVVIHVVLTAAQQTQLGGTAGIIKRIDSQMKVLNRDFQKMNSDSNLIPAVFKPLYGNANMEFGLAHRKPNGQSTLGYEIITTTANSYDATGGTVGSQFSCSDVKYPSQGGAAAWDPSKYLNIWVTNFTQTSILGIAAPASFIGWGFPVGEVGVVINYRAFGKRSSMSDSYISGIDKGRTTTHEVGHFFNLSHIWGDNDDCSDDDGIGDTPKQDDANYTACSPQVLTNCTGSAGGQMYMNYMDYVEDGCMVMFSKGQVTVMQNFYPTALIPDPNIFLFPTEVPQFEIENQFDIFPNPTNGKININFASVPESLQNITITNMVGQKVYEQNAANTTIYNIDITGMSKGIYFVKCHFAEGMVTRKIVLE